MTILSSETLCLLDKNVVRRSVEALLALSRGRELSERKETALVLLDTAATQDETHAAIDAFLEMVGVLYPTRYFRRWARRLHGMTFGREDARILSLGSFGTVKTGDILGAHFVVTWDEHLITKFARELSVIQQRLDTMIADLDPPFANATLPGPRLPEEIVW